MRNTMKKTVLATLLLSVTTAPAVFAADPKLKTIEQQASYTLGTDLAKNFEQQGVEIDTDALVLGMQDILNKRNLRLTPEEMQAAVNKVREKVQAKQAAAMEELAATNLKKGDAFLAKNKKKAGIKTTASGLQYKIITKGKGAVATDEDHLTAHYEGTLIDGTVFDSSYNRGTPIEFQAGNVIRGWGEALTMMNPGSKWELYIPANLAYGEKGAGQAIGPNETLIFTVELITVSKDAPQR